MTKSSYKFISTAEEAEQQKAERERRRKLRLIQVRQQEKRIACQLRKKFQERRNDEIQLITKHLQAKYHEEQDAKINIIKRTYQNSLSGVGHGHKMATQAPTVEPKQISPDAKARALTRHKKALQQIQKVKATAAEAESQRTEAKKGIIEKQRILADSMKIMKPAESELILNMAAQPKGTMIRLTDVQGYASTRHHVPDRYVEREKFDSGKENAMRAAELESERLKFLKQEKERARHEYNEKARLRYQNARSKVLLQKDYNDLMSELREYDLLDRQRRQKAVSNIPVNIFQPSNYKIGDEVDKQAKLEEEFEDLFSPDIDLDDSRFMLEFNSDSSIIERPGEGRVENNMQQNTILDNVEVDIENENEIEVDNFVKEDTEDQLNPMERLLEKIRLQKQAINNINSETELKENHPSENTQISQNVRLPLPLVHESDELKNDYEFSSKHFEKTEDDEKVERSSKASFSQNTDENERKIVHQSEKLKIDSEFRNEASEETEGTEKAERSSKTNVIRNSDKNQKKLEKEYTSDEAFNIGFEGLSLNDKNTAEDKSEIEKQQQMQEQLQRKLLEIQSHSRVLEEQQRQLQQDIQEQQQRWARQKLLQEQDRDTKITNNANIMSDNKQIKLDENDILKHQRLLAREKLLDESKDTNDQVENGIQEDQMQWARQRLLEQKNNSETTDIRKANSIEGSSGKAVKESTDLLVTSDKVKQYQESILHKEVGDRKRRSPLDISSSGRSSHIEELETKLSTEKKELEDLKYQLEQQRLLYNQEKQSRDKKPTEEDFSVKDMESRRQPIITNQRSSLETWLNEFAIENTANEQNLLFESDIASGDNNISHDKLTETTLLDQIGSINNAEEIQFLNFKKNSDSVDKEAPTINNNISRANRNIANDNYGFKLSPVPEEAESDITYYTGLELLRGNNNETENELSQEEIFNNDLIDLSSDVNIPPQTIQLISTPDEEIPTLLELNHQYQQHEKLSDEAINLNNDPQFETDTKLSSYTLSSDTSPNSESDQASIKHQKPENLTEETVADVQLSFDTIFSSYPVELTDRKQTPTMISSIDKERLESDEITEELITISSDRNLFTNVNENDVTLPKDENSKERDFTTDLEIQTSTLTEKNKLIEQTEEQTQDNAKEADDNILFKEDELQHQDVQSNDNFATWNINPSNNRINEARSEEKITLQDAFLRNRKAFIKNSKSRSQVKHHRIILVEPKEISKAKTKRGLTTK